jgi:hypothetical protein
MFNSIQGKRFGKLTVLELTSDLCLFKGTVWNCLCDCGENFLSTTVSLISKQDTDCGCSARNKIDESESTQTPEHKEWRDMINRCYDENHEKFRFYGGKGITVCDRWRKSFENFLEDMGPMCSKEMTLRRGNSRKQYAPNSCRWCPNDSNKPAFVEKKYEYNGKQYTIAELTNLPEAKKSNLRTSTIYTRIEKLNWTIERAISISNNGAPRKSNLIVKYNGVSKSIAEWAKELDIECSKLYRRLVRSNFDLKSSIEYLQNSIKTREKASQYTHNGITKTITEWAKEYKMAYAKLYHRLVQARWSFDRSVNTP